MNKALRVGVRAYEEKEGDCCAVEKSESDLTAALGYASQAVDHIASTLSRLDALLSPILSSDVPEEAPDLRDSTNTIIGASIEEIGNRLARIDNHLNSIIHRSGV